MLKALISWSSGKDSAWALHVVHAREDIEVVGLLTTVNRTFDRVAMHAVRRELLEAQAAAVGLPLITVEIPADCDHGTYEAAMRSAIATARDEGVQAIVFGDLFLDDIRRYREQQLAGSGLQLLFPLWGRPTNALSTDMLASGVVAHVACVDPRLVSPRLAGRTWDSAFIAELPPGADPCGENGEFHTFVSAGPMFSRRLSIVTGEIVNREGFTFADVLLEAGASDREPVMPTLA